MHSRSYTAHTQRKIIHRCQERSEITWASQHLGQVGGDRPRTNQRELVGTAASYRGLFLGCRRSRADRAIWKRRSYPVSSIQYPVSSIQYPVSSTVTSQIHWAGLRLLSQMP